jgi:ferric-dicitrate binding protein FerR (iron transport regulator)
MDPNETANQASDDAEQVADRNVERLLTGAYQPEVSDPAFVEKATAAMHAAARQRPVSPASGQRTAMAKRLIGWTVAAALLVGVGMILGSGLLARRADQQEEVERPENGPQVEGEPILAAGPYVPPVGGTGLTARARPKAPPVDRLAVGERLATSAGQRRRVALPDGSVLYLNQHTVVNLEKSRHLTLHRGEIFVEVAPRHPAEKTSDQPHRDQFVVVTPDRRVTALGTKFDVRTGDEGTRVVVTQGKVQVSGMKLPLLAGQQLDPHGLAGSGTERPVTAARRATHLLDWTKELMATADSPLVPDSRHAGGALITVDPSGQESRLTLRKYHVDVHIEDGFARTTIDQTYFNHEPRRLEGTFYFPLPPDASLSRLAMYVGGQLMEGGMVEREHGREVFETIMYQRKDPALLEWVDGSTFKMRVFPLEGRQEKRIVLSYTQKLPSLYDRTQYRFPVCRGHTVGHNMQLVGHWSARLRVKNGDALRWESDSHQFAVSNEDGDLVLQAEAEKIKPDRDIVLALYDREYKQGGTAGLSSSEGGSPSPEALLDKPAVAPSSSHARFATAVHEGSRYLMLRWRPELPAEQRRQRRDWVFLFEASGDRDPLLGRVQVDVIKTLLENAEHDDTFSIVTAGTRVHAFRAKPQAATPENVERAVNFLEQTHLVGALDLERALVATGPFVEAAENPVLVHVGSGTAVLGKRDVDALVRRIPKGARYVGVGVGKRWSRTLMKTAASRTGGYFTQINPDEQITWRALELLATLNTPRLLDVKVVDDGHQLTLLCLGDSLAQGEELCAIARFDDDGAALPEAVEVTGMLDGKPHSETIPVGDVAEGAAYLPRIWAKLEIDRLVALGAVENKTRIIELSKAMYVMSPFTSLLVLENEQMYQQYKVDRGRKDHWALYPCPEKIPVVYEPDPSRPAGDVPERAAPQKPTAEEVLQTILVQIPPDILHWPNRPHRYNTQTVPVLNIFNGYWSNRPYRHSILVPPVVRIFNGQSAYQYGPLWVPDGGTVFLGGIKRLSEGRYRLGEEVAAWDSSGRLWNVGSGEWNGPVSMEELVAAVSERVAPGGGREIPIRSYGDGLIGPVQIEMLEGLDVLVITGHEREVDRVMKIIEQVETLSAETELGTQVYPVADLVLPLESRAQAYLRNALALRVARQRGVVDTLYQIERSHVPFLDEPLIVYPDPEFWERISTHRIREYSSMTLARQGDARRKIEEALNSPTQLEFVETPLQDVIEYLKDYHRIEIQIHRKALHDVGLDPSTNPITANLKGISLRSALRLILRERDLTYVIQSDVLLITTPEEASRDIALENYSYWVAALMGRIKKGSHPQYLTYQQPSFNNNWSIFHELPAYAPGMNTSMADVRAVLESEARPRTSTAPGEIDKKARKLINKARAAGWQTATIRDEQGCVLLSVDFDGTGRYRYETTTDHGLREQVLCNGTNLWHLYDELGLGARRTLSRFHRAQLTRLVPWAVPPAEDLARGANLVAVDEQTVAIVPHGFEKFGAEEGKPIEYVRVHLRFGSDGRLAERRLVKMPSGKTLLRQTYAADGSVKLLGAEDKVLREWKIDLEPCGAPALKPDEEELVILPLPFREVWSVFKARGLDNRYENWSEEDALAALGGYLAADQHMIREVIARRFFARGDRRVGFYALLIAGGHTWNAKDQQHFGNSVELLCDPLEDHPDHPLAQYVAAYLKLRTGQQQEFNLPAASRAAGFIPAPESDDGFLQELAGFRDLWHHWNSGRANQGDKAERQEERRRALEFIGGCRSPEFGWALWTEMRRRGSGHEFYRELAEAATVFEEVPALVYTFRYERARALKDAGQREQAQELFASLYADTVEAGFLPPIDGSFRDVFQNDETSRARWRKLIRETSEELISDGARPAAVRLAWQIRQVGDQPLAEELFGLALAGTPEQQQLPTTLAAVEYLWHTGQQARADAVLQPLLDHKTYAKSPALWRLAAMLCESRGMTARSLSCVERAMEIEYQNLPEVVNVQRIREDYGRLLSRYQQLAAAIATLEAEPPREFVGRVVRAADRWRQVDPDPTAACHTAARILGDLGAAEMAWEYLTTPLAAKPFEAAPWVSTAEMLRQQGHFELADRAYASAFEAEPTNAQILWDRAQVLLQAGRAEDAKELFGQLAEGKWQPRFSWLQSRAQQYVEKD